MQNVRHHCAAAFSPSIQSVPNSNIPPMIVVPNLRDSNHIQEQLCKASQEISILAGAQQLLEVTSKNMVKSISPTFPLASPQKSPDSAEDRRKQIFKPKPNAKQDRIKDTARLQKSKRDQLVHCRRMQQHPSKKDGLQVIGFLLDDLFHLLKTACQRVVSKTKLWEEMYMFR